MYAWERIPYLLGSADLPFYLLADHDQDPGNQNNADPDTGQTLPSREISQLHFYAKN
jgi:hypothetical protein